MLIFRASAKACLVNQRFHWKRCTSARLEVGAGAPSYPQTAKDHFRRVYCEAVDLMVSAIYQESFSSYAQMETLLVKAANGDDYEAEFKFLEASYREDVDTGALPGHATKYFGSYVIGEDSMFWRNPVGGVKVSKTRREANSGSPNYLSAGCCKSCNQRCWRAFILICTASEDVASIQDGWPSSVEWSQAENRQCLYSYTGVCFLQ